MADCPGRIWGDTISKATFVADYFLLGLPERSATMIRSDGLK
jgi:hypothetical protein